MSSGRSQLVGRILRLPATDGRQPSVEVRATNVIGIGTELVVAGLNMIGRAAGDVCLPLDVGEAEALSEGEETWST